DDAGHGVEWPPAHRRRREAGGSQVRPGPPRRADPGSGGHPGPGCAMRRPPPPRGLVLLDRLPPRVHRWAPRHGDGLLPRGGADRRAGGARRDRSVRRVVPGPGVLRGRRLREAIEAGERALPVFERAGNVWWACRTLWILTMTSNAMGAWG